MEDMNTVVRVERFKTHLHPQGLQRNHAGSGQGEFSKYISVNFLKLDQKRQKIC